jgi:desulfoferrodoxin (superoxide reductase-like protein)
MQAVVAISMIDHKMQDKTKIFWMKLIDIDQEIKSYPYCRTTRTQLQKFVSIIFRKKLAEKH